MFVRPTEYAKGASVGSCERWLVAVAPDVGVAGGAEVSRQMGARRTVPLCGYELLSLHRMAQPR